MEKLTVTSVDNALKSNPYAGADHRGPYFHQNPRLLAIVEEAVKRGYVLRTSHSQAEWTEAGLVKARRDTAEATLVEILESYNVQLTPGELRDFDLQGDETDKALDQMARDYVSELDSERAEAAAFKKNPGSVDPINF